MDKTEDERRDSLFDELRRRAIDGVGDSRVLNYKAARNIIAAYERSLEKQQATSRRASQLEAIVESARNGATWTRVGDSSYPMRVSPDGPWLEFNHPGEGWCRFGGAMSAALYMQSLCELTLSKE